MARAGVGRGEKRRQVNTTTSGGKYMRAKKQNKTQVNGWRRHMWMDRQRARPTPAFDCYALLTKGEESDKNIAERSGDQKLCVICVILLCSCLIRNI